MTWDEVPADRAGQVILYTQNGCADSARVRAWLAEQGVSFVDRNVTDDPAAAQGLIATGVLATPLAVIGERSVLGFRPAELRAALPEERGSRGGSARPGRTDEA